VETGSSSGPLGDLVVVDASEGVGGGHASRLLGDLGARVVKVEPPGGDRLRALGPFAPGGESPRELGGLHLALGAGKESVVVDLDDASGRGRLLEMLEGAEIFLESAEPGEMARRGLDYASLASRFPRLVYASQTPFGQDGPYARRRSSEIVDYAMGGYMYFCGEPGRPPLMVPGFQGELHAGMQLALGALIALWHARRTGTGQQVDVSTFESMLGAHCWLTTLWTHKGLVQERLGSTLIRCSDGYVYWMAPRPALDLFVLIERFDGGPAGVEALAAGIGEDRGTIEDVYEPFLVRAGFVLRTPRGRVAGPAAYSALGLSRPGKHGDNPPLEGLDI